MKGRNMAEEEAQIMAIPFHGQGHLFPCIELCKRLAARGLPITIVADSSVTATLRTVANHSSSGLRITVIELESEEEEESAPHPDHHHPHGHDHMQQQQKAMEDILQKLSTPPLCIIGDVMMGWIPELCNKFGIPRVSFFTSGACSLAFEYAIWKHRSALDQLQQDDKQAAFSVPGFPPSMSITQSDLQHRAPPFPPGGGGGGGPPPPPGRRPPPPPPGSKSHSPPWMNGIKDCVGILINTCEELECPFIEYIEKEIEKPIWAAGPLLPSSSFSDQSGTTVTHDSAIRSKKSSIDEDQCLEWLNSKAPASVLFVSFGSEVGPSDEEIRELALGLEAAQKPFIWVLQNHYHDHLPPPDHPPRHQGSDEAEGGEDLLPEGFEGRIEGLGLIIRGWAPQLLILSHPSTGGFLSHCGWNSAVESIDHGVPILAWPIRGDQHYNAKLLVNDLQIAAMIDMPTQDGLVNRKEIGNGVKLLMESEHGAQLRERAASLKLKFRSTNFLSSQAVLDTFLDHLLRKQSEVFGRNVSVQVQELEE
jgi:hypothetical protein